MFHKLFLYIHCKNLIYQKKLEPNERKRSQSNYFSFKTSEIIYILMYFWANQIAPEQFKKIRIVPRGIIIPKR